MKVLHGPQNIGGMAGVLARAQRRCGIDAYAYCYPTGSFRYEADRVIQTQGSSGREVLNFFLKEGLRYDGYQLYFGTSWTGLKLKELAALKALGKKLYFLFCGCDVRDSKLTITKYRFSACANCWPMLCSPNRSAAIEAAERYADAIFVTTPDLLEFVPGSVLLPQPIDLEAFEVVREQALLQSKQVANGGPIRIAHAPSNQAIKGTKFLISAVESLREQGHSVELLLVEGKSYAEAMSICASADIVVDQLLVGAYGQYAVEMMALGKPVICYIREDLRNFYPAELPIISANIDNIENILKGLLRDRDQWINLGARGLDYVKRHHDSVTVAKRALRHY